MKRFSLFFTLCILFTSCETELNEMSGTSTTDAKYFANFNSARQAHFKGLEVQLPEGYPTNLLEFTLRDFEDIALNRTSKNVYKVKHVRGNSLVEIIEEVYKLYPSFDYFDAKAYQRIFPKMTMEEISENSETILDYIEKIMAFDIVSAFSQLNGAEYSLISNERKARGYISSGDWLNTACTVSVVISHPRLDISGLRLAVDNANYFCGVYGSPTNNGGSNDYMDAVRHGIWGVYLGKEGTWRYSNPDKAMDIVSQLLLSHECGQSGIGTGMDMQNNRVALEYYRNNVEVTGSWPNRNTRINKTFREIAITISAYPCHLVSTVSEISSKDAYTLVRLQ